MTDTELEDFMKEVSDLEYFEGKLRRAEKSGQNVDRLQRQIDLLEDAIIIYHEFRHPSSDELKLLKFGFSKGYIIRLLIDKYEHHIPPSLLVQTFMRKLQDDMDRRRP